MDAFQRRFRAGYSRVLVVGSDCPELTCTHIEAGIAALGRVSLVLGPAADGGYWLVGQRSPGCDVFSGVPWSSPHTLESTRVRARSAGVASSELEVLGDIDTEDDLRMALASDGLDRGLVRGLRADLAMSSQRSR